MVYYNIITPSWLRDMKGVEALPCLADTQDARSVFSLCKLCTTVSLAQLITASFHSQHHGTIKKKKNQKKQEKVFDSRFLKYTLILFDMVRNSKQCNIKKI